MVNDTVNFIAGFGIIPNDWSCKTANEICTKISKGTTPPKSEISNEGNIPFLRVNNLTFHGRLALDSDFIFVSKESHENFLSRSMAFPNDILMNIVGPPLGKTALLDDSYLEYNMNQAIVFYRLQKNLVDSKYFLEFLNSFKAQQWLQSRSKKTSGQQNLTIEICKDLPIILPPLVEQKKIAQILSTWDRAISATEKLLANSQQQKNALMQQLLTGKKRLLDENGVEFSDEWQRFSLGSIAKVYQPKTISQSELSSDGYPVYGANGIIGYYSDFNHELEQIAVTCRGSTCGVVNWTLPKSWITGNAMVINVDGSVLVDKKFLFYVLGFSDLKYLITGSGQPQITGDIKNHVVSLAPIEEQKSIAYVLTLADQEIDILQKKLDCLKQEKKALMQQLLTGKKRVKVSEGE